MSADRKVTNKNLVVVVAQLLKNQKLLEARVAALEGTPAAAADHDVDASSGGLASPGTLPPGVARVTRT